jgi:amphi-Trp domain-containing protein
MGDDKNKLEYEIQTTLEDGIAKLESLINGLKKREVILRNRTEAVDLHPPSVISMAVKAKQKGSKETIEIELAWKRDSRLTEDADRLQIGGSEAGSSRRGDEGS